MIPAHETLDGTWPYAARYADGAGFRQHYIDEGSGPPVVMLHGEPTWGYLWRNFIDPLAATNRVIVPDHMGFGKSETPQDRSYTALEHVLNLEKMLVETLDLTDITLVLHDWGGPIGHTFALRNPDRIRRIFATNTFLPVGLPEQDQIMGANAGESPWFQWVAKNHFEGTLDQQLGNAANSIVQLMLSLQTIAHPAIMTPTWVRAYTSAFPTREESIGAIRFPQQLFDGTSDAPAPPREAVEALRTKPAMFVAGLRDTALLPRHTIAAFDVAYPGRPVITLPNAGHFSPEDEPEILLALLQLFLQST